MDYNIRALLDASDAIKKMKSDNDATCKELKKTRLKVASLEAEIRQLRRVNKSLERDLKKGATFLNATIAAFKELMNLYVYPYPSDLEHYARRGLGKPINFTKRAVYNYLKKHLPEDNK